MAKRSPSSSSRSSSRGTADDAFTARILEFTAWARQNTQLLVVGIVVVVIGVVGTIYYLNQRSTQLERAAIELEVVHQAAAVQPAEEARAQLRAFLARYGGTPYGVEARLLLAELLLDDGRGEEAIQVLHEVAPSYRDPLRIQATFLLAVAYEEEERWGDAATVYRELRNRGEFSFQRREAAEGLARSLVAEGDTTGAASVLERLLADDVDEDDPARGYYEMRLAELTGGGS